MSGKLRIGISACLLGQKVRYDGGHKHDRFITETLGKIIDFVPICPEVECGLAVPREAMHLQGNPVAPRLVVIRSGVDLTEQMRDYCLKKTEELGHERLSGFILKARSPSCGVYNSPIQIDAETILDGAGFFALAVQRGFPGLPIEDEETIRDPERLRKFLEQAEKTPAPG